jgi:hypothetical protein
MFVWPSPRAGSVFDLDQFPQRAHAVAGDARRTPVRRRGDAVAGDEHAIVAPADVALDDHVAAVAARELEGGRHLLGRRAVHGHALALVAVERLEGGRAAQAARRALRLLHRGDGRAFGHRHACLFQQRLGQLLVAGELDGDMAGHRR